MFMVTCKDPRKMSAACIYSTTCVTKVRAKLSVKGSLKIYFALVNNNGHHYASWSDSQRDLRCVDCDRCSNLIPDLVLP